MEASCWRAIGADAPSLDPHQERTFATIQLVAPLYSTLLQIDPLSYPKVIGDVATEWKIAPDGLTYTFKIRQGIKFQDGSPLTASDVKATYDKIMLPPDFAVFAIQEWRKIGIEAEHRPMETAAWFADGRDTGSFELIISGVFHYIDDPDLFLQRYTTGDPNNWGRFSDPRIDDLYARQARVLDPAERKRLVNEIEKIVLENAYYIPGLWWRRSVVHWAKVQNYVAPPNHYSNQKLQDVWLAED